MIFRSHPFMFIEAIMIVLIDRVFPYALQKDGSSTDYQDYMEAKVLFSTNLFPFQSSFLILRCYSLK